MVWNLQIDCFAVGVARDTHPTQLTTILCYVFFFFW